MRVLVVKMSSLGDVIHTLPALSDAAAGLRNIRFDWVVEEAFAEVPGWHPAVDTVIPVALRRWRRRPLRDFRGAEWRRARARLRRVRYDALIDAQGLLKSAFISRLVQAPRFGMDRHSAREGFAALAYDHRVTVPREMHAVERTRLLFARALNYRHDARPLDYGLTTLGRAAVADGPPALVFCHGTSGPEKLWPLAHWRGLVRLATAGGYRMWLPWGNGPEYERALTIARGSPAVQVLPRSSLEELALRMRQAAGVVAVDTGLGHLAAALGVPAVSLYGATRIPLVGTRGERQVHLQAPRTEGGGPGACMADITPAAVWDALATLIEGLR
jgi:heptosyltransferase-1